MGILDVEKHRQGSNSSIFSQLPHSLIMYIIRLADGGMFTHKTNYKKVIENLNTMAGRIRLIEGAYPYTQDHQGGVVVGARWYNGLAGGLATMEARPGILACNLPYNLASTYGWYPHIISHQDYNGVICTDRFPEEVTDEQRMWMWRTLNIEVNGWEPWHYEYDTDDEDGEDDEDDEIHLYTPPISEFHVRYGIGDLPVR